MATQMEIARRLGLDISSVNKILNRKPGPVFKQETIQKVFRIARQLGYNFAKLKHTHRRRAPRYPVTMATTFTLSLKEGTVFDQGKATLKDISLYGARVSELHLPSGTFPAKPFLLTLCPSGKPLENLELKGQVVRLHANDSLELGIAFEESPPQLARKIRKLS